VVNCHQYVHTQLRNLTHNQTQNLKKLISLNSTTYLTIKKWMLSNYNPFNLKVISLSKNTLKNSYTLLTRKSLKMSKLKWFQLSGIRRPLIEWLSLFSNIFANLKTLDQTIIQVVYSKIMNLYSMISFIA
jgi:hypothetical protein